MHWRMRLVYEPKSGAIRRNPAQSGAFIFSETIEKKFKFY